MTGLVPVTHADATTADEEEETAGPLGCLACRIGVGGRDRPGHDGGAVHAMAPRPPMGHKHADATTADKEEETAGPLGCLACLVGVGGRDRPGHDGGAVYAMAPRAAMGHKHSTRPWRTPTYQS